MTGPAALERLRHGLAAHRAGRIDTATLLRVVTPDDLALLVDPPLALAPDEGLPATVLSRGSGSGRLVDAASWRASSDTDQDVASAGGVSGAPTKESSELVVLLCDRLDVGLLRHAHRFAAVVTVTEDATAHAVILARSAGLPLVQVAPGLAAGLRRESLGRQVAVDALHGALHVLRDGDRPGVGGAGHPPECDELLDVARRHTGLHVFANADTGREIGRARDRHATGFEPRLEHMLVAGDALLTVRAALFGAGPDRVHHLDRLESLVDESVVLAFNAAHGLPVYVRLLDPPSHEFAPAADDESGWAELAAHLGEPVDTVRARCAAAAETNPMLGLRGARLLLRDPELCRAQLRAFRKAAASTGATAHVTLPMVSSPEEVVALAAAVREVFAGHETGVRIGAMVETPRAALLAGYIAPHVDYLSFGTNDLTAQVFGLSRGDTVARVLQPYLEAGWYPHDPFVQLDPAVAELVRVCVDRARAANPAITFTVCGEQAGHDTAVALAAEIGIDAVAVGIADVPRLLLAAAVATTSGAHVGERVGERVGGRVDEDVVGEADPEERSA
jgi:pyruvate,orthophosphate dikinase